MSKSHNSHENKAITSVPSSFYNTIHLDDALVDPEVYRDLLLLLRRGAPGDTNHFLINSPGGDVGLALGIGSALAAGSGHNIMEITGTCASAATFIFLQGDEFLINEHASFMVHTASFGAGGSVPHVVDYVNHTRLQISNLMHKTYKDFMTVEEIEQALDGKEFWFLSEELGERLQKRADLRKAASEKENLEHALKEQKELDAYVATRLEQAVDNSKQPSVDPEPED